MNDGEAYMTRLILVRHGETAANREFRYIGRRDDALSERGVAQAKQLAEALAMLPIAAVYSSPLQRAYQTALPIAARHGLEVRKADDLREGDFGMWEGYTRDEIIARGGQEAEYLFAWQRDAALAPPGGESLVDMRDRACAATTSLAQAHPGQMVVLVSHVGPVKALLCTALGAPLTSMFHIFLDPATISVVERSSQRTRLLEIGTSNGYSTIWLAWATHMVGGHVISIDRDKHKQALADANLRRAGLRDVVELIRGDATQVVAELGGPFDCVFFDADRLSAPSQLALLLPKLTADAFLFADNVLSHPQEIADYLAAVEALPQFDHLVVPVGKGLSIAYRQKD